MGFARRITSGVSGTVEDYRKFLTTGGSLHPIDELRIAGVDMSRQESVQSTVDQFAATLEQLEELL